MKCHRRVMGEFHSIYTAPGPRKKEEKKKDILFFGHQFYTRDILSIKIYIRHSYISSYVLEKNNKNI